MAVTEKTKRTFEIALVSKALADELEAALASPAPLSDELSRALEIAVADVQAAVEIQAAVESGAASLSRRSGNALAIGLASNEAAEEIFSF